MGLVSNSSGMVCRRFVEHLPDADCLVPVMDAGGRSQQRAQIYPRLI
jgi:hypothetical protein